MQHLTSACAQLTSQRFVLQHQPLWSELIITIARPTKQAGKAQKTEMVEPERRTSGPHLQCSVTPRYLLVLALALPLVALRALQPKRFSISQSLAADFQLASPYTPLANPLRCCFSSLQEAGNPPLKKQRKAKPALYAS